ADGEQTYAASDKVVLEGIVLNYPADVLDPTPDDSLWEPFNLGGQWQIFFQGEGDDRAGTAVWLGQLYNNLPWVSLDGGYSDEEFIDELARIHACRFSPGDRIRVTGYFLSYKGKLNINEHHNKDLEYDFTIDLIKAGVGLPKPEPITLDDLKDDQDGFVFDPHRERGCEYYQSRLVKLRKVWFSDANDWRPNGALLVTDGRKTLPVKLGRGTGIYPGSNNLVEPFDAIGILDQESTGLKGGYRLMVTDYDGNGHVLASREHRLADKPGDTNLDGMVDFVDLAQLAADWLAEED
ncbi:MAG: hypothetical protein ACYTAS_18305, partial [Planctomycetota bacterium]